MSILVCHTSMLSRFEGPDGTQRLIETLQRQTLISGDAALAKALAQKGSLVEAFPFSTSETIITQGGADDDIYFIISGEVSILVNRRPIAVRNAGTHFGEMALIDPTVRRSATVIALEPSLLFRISERDFTELAQNYPNLWRNIAVEIGNRLRERNKYVRQLHNKSVIFIGSSSEKLEIAQEIQLGFQYCSDMVVRVWTDGIFRASRTSIESLIPAIEEADFAILVISPDDLIESRGDAAYGPRDNVIFELGLFIGGIGRERTFIVKARKEDVKVPSDLLGIKPLDYALGSPDTLTPRIAPVCTEIRRYITQMGPR